MYYTMCRTQCVALVVLFAGLAHSWDIVVSVGDHLDFYANGTKTDTVHFVSQNLAALAYDEVHNVILYVEKQSDNDAIGGYNLSTMQYKYFIQRNGRNIQGLAFDPATEKLFFTDTNERSINWISLKPGSQNNVHGNLMIKMEDGIPTDIAVDSCNGYIYWITTDLKTPRIERARFDGSEREVVINTNAVPVNTTYKVESHSLTIDQQTQKMFWVEPKTELVYHTYRADLNGQNKVENSLFEFSSKSKILSNLSSVLTVSKDSLFSWIWCADCSVWEEPKVTNYAYIIKKSFVVKSKNPIGITANYKIEHQIQGLQNCEALKSLVQNDSLKHYSLKIATEYNGPYCVHGTKVNDQSQCKCTPGYIGERCDVSVCENYCLQGNCSSNDEGLPTCSCNAGYSGERCEFNMCHGYCLNDGDCSLNEEDEPVCECVSNHEGSRCETDRNDTKLTYNPVKQNLTLYELLSRFQKPNSKIFVAVEVS